MSSDLNPLQTRLADGSGGQFDLTEDTVDQMLALAERLRMSNGGVLDDDAIQAVAEATGAPTEYVRLAVKVRAEKENRSRLTNLRAQFLTLDPETRRMVGVGTMATVCAFLFALEYRLGTSVSQYGVLSMVGLIALSLGLYQVALSKDVKWAGVNGAILGGAFFGMYAVFSLLMQSAMRIYAPAILPIMIGGGIAGALLKKAVEKNRDSLGLRDPIKERQELLSQLVELQDRLRSGEQSVTFLSVDIVGSTKMKLNLVTKFQPSKTSRNRSYRARAQATRRKKAGKFILKTLRPLGNIIKNYPTQFWVPGNCLIYSLTILFL